MQISPVADVLARHHAVVAESDVAAALDAGFREGWLRPDPTPTAALSRDARAVLTKHGGLPASTRQAVRDNASRVMSRLAMEMSTALTTSQVAELLGIDPTRVRHRLSEGSLYALPTREGRSRRFPAWQFDGGGVLPHLKRVLDALPAGLHPLEVAGFFSTRHDVLEVDEQSVSARDWLVGGGDPQPVVALAAALHAGT
jgi:hypothetical protein